MPAVRSGGLQSAINVTPLVDVVLVLLIIFMVIAPQLRLDTALMLPRTQRPADRPENERQIVVMIDAAGAVWIDDRKVTAEQLVAALRGASGDRRDAEVVIKGDARLTFGSVHDAMLAIESAGFANVGLIAERDSGPAREG